IADAGNFLILAIAKISASALAARSVMAAMPSDTDTLPHFPRGNTCTQFVDYAGHFVSGNAGILNSRPTTFLSEHITVTDTTSLLLDEDVSRAGLRNVTLDNLEICSWLGNLCHFHRCYCFHWDFFSCCHKSSDKFSAG